MFFFFFYFSLSSQEKSGSEEPPSTPRAVTFAVFLPPGHVLVCHLPISVRWDRDWERPRVLLGCSQKHLGEGNRGREAAAGHRARCCQPREPYPASEGFEDRGAEEAVALVEPVRPRWQRLRLCPLRC